MIGILENDSAIEKRTAEFISNWILTDASEKRKAFFDVWDIVLRNYLPQTRPVLFRSCNRIGRKDKLASFTGRIDEAKRIGQGKGLILICNTAESLKFEDQLYQTGNYQNTFYPLASVLRKSRILNDSMFSDRLLDYEMEDEYIMRIRTEKMHVLKWA
ncbi:hypothetical protein BST86_04790 [Nonlabens agnitus]|uniref:Uncharacterized protein n=1 Tax=Nonlabens agnitus TaxID=870484 RepID=A0A2S9WXV6_9FLAO|nr:hypothetical protein BST86_04790 [Nonlabens agnitus]